MSRPHHQLAHDFFDAIARGSLPDDLVTPDMQVWTITSGAADKARFQSGIAMLASLFSGTLKYTVTSLTAEEDRVVAEAESHGTLNGEPYRNTHVFVFRVRDERIAFIAEYMNQFTVREKIIPLLQELMRKRSGTV